MLIFDLMTMKKHFFLFLQCLPLFLIAQNTHGDSLYYSGQWYSRADYDKVLDRAEKMDFSTWFMPGISYSMYRPSARDSFGVFSGLTVEYLIYAKVEQNNHPGPSHVRVYSKLSILNSDKKPSSAMLQYAMGLDLSLEKNPKRNFLVPYFGLEAGGLSNRLFKTTFCFTPTIGIHLLSTRNLFVNVHAGYNYPINNFEMLKGWSYQAGLNFALW